MTSGRFGPTPATERIASIDFVRGVALLGILLVNVTSFFGPVATLFEPSLVVGMATPDRAAYLLVVSLCQGKFISLFSMLFGYGLLGQIERAAGAGRSPGKFVLRRLGTLAVFGLLHALAVWYGDVLFVYAVLGGWLLLARGAKARSLLKAAVVLLAVSAGLRAGLELLNTLSEPRTVRPMSAAPLPDGPRGLGAMLQAGPLPVSPVWVQAEVAAYRDGPWHDAQLFRLAQWLFNMLTVALAGGWQVLGMFFLGAALWRVRFFDPSQSGLRVRVLLVCLPLGAALEGVAAGFYRAGLTDRLAWAAGSGIQGLAVCVLPAGYLAGLALLADRLPAWLRTPVASAGRMALTVYLLESVLATALAYHWGLRLFGVVGARTQLLLGLAIWVGLVLFAWAYLRFFEQGPLERLWRRLEYGPRRSANGG
jgi:uncharacterized protein